MGNCISSEVQVKKTPLTSREARRSDFNDFDGPSGPLRNYAIARTSTTDLSTSGIQKTISDQYRQGHEFIEPVDPTQPLAAQRVIVLRNIEKLKNPSILGADKTQIIRQLIAQAQTFIQDCYDIGGEDNMRLVGDLINVYLFEIFSPANFPNEYLSKEKVNSVYFAKNSETFEPQQKFECVKKGLENWDIINVEQRALLFVHAVDIFRETCKPFKVVFTTFNHHHFGLRIDLEFKFTLPGTETPTVRRISPKTSEMKEFITCVCNETAVNKYILGTAPVQATDAQPYPQ